LNYVVVFSNENQMILGCGVLLIEVDFECTLSFTRKCMNYLTKEEKYLN